MRLVQETVFREVVLCLLCALVNKSKSRQLLEFQWLKTDNDELMCATSPPNKTLSAIATRLQCVNRCSDGCPSSCEAVNYRQSNQQCEMFYYVPCSYDLQPDCANYQVGLRRS